MHHSGLRTSFSFLLFCVSFSTFAKYAKVKNEELHCFKLKPLFDDKRLFIVKLSLVLGCFSVGSVCGDECAALPMKYLLSINLATAREYYWKYSKKCSGAIFCSNIFDINDYCHQPITSNTLVKKIIIFMKRTGTIDQGEFSQALQQMGWVNISYLFP